MRSPIWILSPGFVGAGRGGFRSPQGALPTISGASPPGWSPLFRASRAREDASFTGPAAAALSAAAAAADKPTFPGGSSDSFRPSDVQVSRLLRDLGYIPGLAADLQALEALEGRQLHRLVKRESDLLAEAETLSWGRWTPSPRSWR